MAAGFRLSEPQEIRSHRGFVSAVTDAIKVPRPDLFRRLYDCGEKSEPLSRFNQFYRRQRLAIFCRAATAAVSIFGASASCANRPGNFVPADTFKFPNSGIEILLACRFYRGQKPKLVASAPAQG
jgi:hypothetical protein